MQFLDADAKSFRNNIFVFTYSIFRAEEDFRHEDVILLIGPEGDFSPAEIACARAAGYVEIKLGNRRLRTETAGLYGCLTVAIKTENHY